jgi:hypothetical protein
MCVIVVSCGGANESGTDAAGTSVDAQGCGEEILEKGFEAITRLGGELWTVV